MNRHKGAQKRPQVIPVWTYEQATKALPYITSVMKTIREYYIKAQQSDLEAKRLAVAPGRPDRDAIIGHEEACRDSRVASERSKEAIDELQALGVFCVDAIRGEALVPFARDQQLAWFVFDLFDSECFRFWRYHEDKPDMRRPIAEVQCGAASPPLIV
jgi:hypothetical protein